MMVIGITEVRIEARIKLNGHKLVLGQLGGIDEPQIPTWTAEGLIIRREEEGKAIAEGSGVDVGDGEGESCGERGGDVGIGVVKSDGFVVNNGAGARGRDAELLGEADYAVAEVGIAEESEVSDVERSEIEADALYFQWGEENEEKGENEKVSWGHWRWKWGI